MNKFTFIIALLSFFLFSNCAFSSDAFSALDNLTNAQLHQISNIQNSFKIKNNELETRISNYIDKITKLKVDSDKTAEQVDLLIGAYERNIATLKSQQEILLKETNKLYKTVLNDTQYKQYQAMQLNSQNAFSNFIKK